MSQRDDFSSRLDAVESRLAALAATVAPPTALTDADPGSGERWDGGQVWAHLAEFVPYWIDQIRTIVAAGDAEPVGFGRTKNDAGRITAIARDRTLPVAVLWSDTRTDIALLRALLDELSPEAWRARGLHPTLGVMGMERIVDDFLVGHLEQHADQLEALGRGSA